MKKMIIAAFCSFAFTGPGAVYGTTVISPETSLPTITWLDMKANEFVKLTTKDYARIYGKKLSMKEKFAFMILKKNLKNELKKNPNLTVQEFLIAGGNKKISTGAWIAIILVGALLILIIVANAGGFGPYL